jgi:hypothetical protein
VVLGAAELVEHQYAATPDLQLGGVLQPSWQSDPVCSQLCCRQLQRLNVARHDPRHDQPIGAHPYRRLYRLNAQPILAINPEHVGVFPDEPKHLVRVGTQRGEVHPLIHGRLRKRQIDDS